MKVITHIGYSLFTAILLGVVGLFLLPVMPFSTNIELKIVESGSMEPAIMTGALVLIAPAATYLVDDVITFSGAYTSIPTTHRIASIESVDNQLVYTTKGDANEEVDTAKVYPTDIIGKVYLAVPYAGFILDFARQPLGFALLIVLPALLIIFSEVVKIVEELRTRYGGRRRATVVVTPKAVVVPQHNNVAVRREPRPRAVPMLDIATPVRVHTARPTYELVVPAWKPTPKPVATNRISFAAVTFVVLTSVSLLHPWFIGSTLSFARDEEVSQDNEFLTRALDFTAVADATEFVFDGAELVDDDGAVIITSTPLSNTPALRYDVSINYVAGSVGLCASLDTDVTSSFTYQGPLLSLAASSVDFTDPWVLPITRSGNLDDFAGESCSFIITLEAVYADAVSQGYIDVEQLTLTVSVPEPVPLAPLLFETFSLPPEDVQTNPEVVDVPPNFEALPPPITTQGVVDVPPAPPESSEPVPNTI